MSGVKILKATYGVSGSTSLDVTKAVSSHIKDGVINLTITPDSLNVTDPAPGQQKTLDVSYVINNGNTMTQTLKDNEVLMISGPPERLATGLQIVKAEYGYTGNFTDVTSAIQNQVKDGTLKLKVGPSTVGIPDPNPNKQKTLAVEYEINGYPSTTQVTDGNTLNISAPPIDQPDNTPPSKHVISIVGIIYKSIVYFALAFLYILSIKSAYRAGELMGYPPMVFGAIAALIPYSAFVGIPIALFFYKLIIG